MARNPTDAAIGLASTSPSWEISDTYAFGAKTLSQTSVVAIHGQRGARFRFLRHVRRPDGVEWIDYVGGTSRGTHEVKMLRSFRPDRISRVVRA